MDETTAGLLGLGATALAANYGFNQASNIEDRAAGISSDLTTLGDNLNTGSQFQGYGVTSRLGNSSISPNGSVNMGVGPNTQMQNQAMGMMGSSINAMNNAMQSTPQREQDIYNRMMLAQQPQLNQMQAAQQAREYAMGRGGVRGSQFGGTAEDAAMARARAQASNQAYLAAMQQALAEQQQQTNMAGTFGQLGQQQYSNSFLPMNQQMALMQLAQGDADRAQTGQLTGQGYLAQMGLGGMQTEVNALKTAAELRGNVLDSILDNLVGKDQGILGLFTS
jgi:hypothetical protein